MKTCTTRKKKTAARKQARQHLRTLAPQWKMHGGVDFGFSGKSVSFMEFMGQYFTVQPHHVKLMELLDKYPDNPVRIRPLPVRLRDPGWVARILAKDRPSFAITSFAAGARPNDNFRPNCIIMDDLEDLD